MGQLRSVTLEGAGTTVEYVRRRGMLRFGASGRGGYEEVSPAALLRKLGVDVTELAPARQFLLFGGSDWPPVGGLGDLVAVFDSEDDARDRFRQLRLIQNPGRRWAELAALDAAGCVRRLCWFGARPVGGRLSPEAHVDSGSRPRPFGRWSWRRPTSFAIRMATCEVERAVTNGEEKTA